VFDAVSGAQMVHIRGHDGLGVCTCNGPCYHPWSPVPLAQCQVVGLSDRVRAVALSSCGRRMATGDQDGDVAFWDVFSGAVLFKLDGHASAIVSMAFSQDGDLLASLDRGGAILLWDVGNHALKHRLTLPGAPSPFCPMHISLDGKLACGGSSGSVWIRDLETLDLLHTLTGHTRAVVAVAFAPNGATLATSG
jgi:WD40 repeat protein